MGERRKITLDSCLKLHLFGFYVASKGAGGNYAFKMIELQNINTITIV